MVQLKDNLNMHACPGKKSYGKPHQSYVARGSVSSNHTNIVTLNRTKANILNANKRIVLLTNKYSNILLVRNYNIA